MVVSHLHIKLDILIHRLVNTGDVENIHELYFSDEDQTIKAA